MTETEKVDLKKYCLVLYVTYAISAALQVFDDMDLLCLSILTLAIAGHLCKKKKAVAQGTIYASHLAWLYRTAWIASCVAIPVNLGLTAGLIWMFTDLGSIVNQVMSGDVDAITSGAQSYMAANMGKIALFNAIGAAPPTIWWLHRCWRGYLYLKANMAIDHVKSWR